MQKVAALIAKFRNIEITSITADTKWRDLVEDSLDQMEIVLALEDEFQIDIDDDDINTLITIHDIAAYLGDNDDEEDPQSQTTEAEVEPISDAEVNDGSVGSER